MIRFFVVGTPRPAGSKRVGVVRRKDTHGNWVPATTPDGRIKMFVKDDSGTPGEDWRADVKQAAMDIMEGRPALAGPLFVELHFRFPRNKGHYGSGRNADILKPSAPTWHSTRPDADKVSRGTLDALKEVVWKDDAQIVHKLVTKRYAERHLGERAGVSIMVSTEFEFQDPEEPVFAPTDEEEFAPTVLTLEGL